MIKCSDSLILEGQGVKSLNSVDTVGTVHERDLVRAFVGQT